MQRLHIITDRLRAHLHLRGVRRPPQPLRITGALAVLLLIGAGVVLASPGSSPIPHSARQLVQLDNADPATDTPAESATASVASTATQTPDGASPTDVPGATPTPTDAPGNGNGNPQSPTATATPGDTPAPDSPTATPTESPAPTPTATPDNTPRWHTLGSYSGETLETVATLHHLVGPLRIQWTCTPVDGVPYWIFAVDLRSVRYHVDRNEGIRCCLDGTSGTFDYTPQYTDPGGDFILSVNQNTPATVGPWTLVVQEWY